MSAFFIHALVLLEQFSLVRSVRLQRTRHGPAKAGHYVQDKSALATPPEGLRVIRSRRSPRRATPPRRRDRETLASDAPRAEPAPRTNTPARTVRRRPPPSRRARASLGRPWRPQSRARGLVRRSQEGRRRAGHTARRSARSRPPAVAAAAP